QLAYLRALISGKTITAAAEEAGVARKTVYRWQSNPRFAAVLNAWRNQAMESARTQLVGLTDEAIETLSVALKKNRDVRVALALLKGVGGLSPKVTSSRTLKCKNEVTISLRAPKGARRFFCTDAFYKRSSAKTQCCRSLRSTMDPVCTCIRYWNRLRATGRSPSNTSHNKSTQRPARWYQHSQIPPIR